MNQSLKDTVTKGIFKVIKRATERARGDAIDPIDLTERLMDTVELLVDMDHEESGIASISPDLRTDTAAWDIRQNKPAADPDDDRPHFLAPPPTRQSVTPLKTDPKAKGLLVMPGDPEFDKVKPADVGGRPGVIKASMRKVSPPRTKGPPKQYWDESGLIEALTANTPEDIQFDIPRINGTQFRIVAKRNVLNLPGIGAALTYRDSRGGENVPDAKHTFSLFDEGIDIEAGMDDVAVQLSGIYKDRSGGAPSPMALGPEPNLYDYMRTGIPGGNVDVHIDRDESGRAVVIDSPLYAERGQDAVLQQVLRSARRENARLVPPESRLK